MICTFDRPYDYTALRLNRVQFLDHVTSFLATRTQLISPSVFLVALSAIKIKVSKQSDRDTYFILLK